MTPEQLAYAVRAQAATIVAKAVRQRHKVESIAATAYVIARANELLPVIVRDFGDTPQRQAARRIALGRVS